MAKEINSKQFDDLLLRVRALVTQYEAARQTLQRVKLDWQGIYDRQFQVTEQAWDSRFDHLLAMSRDKDFPGVIESLNAELSKLADIDE